MARFVLTAMLLALAAGPARAWTPSAAALAQLRQGAVVAEVAGDLRRGAVVHGAVEIAASPTKIWRLITDCARAPRLAPSVRSCRIIERDPEGRWDVREMVLRYGFLFMRVRSRFRSDFDPERRISFTCVAGGDFRACTGEWRLEPLDGGARTRVIYENTATADLPAPGALVRTVLRMDVPAALRALRSEAQAARP